MLPQMNAEQRRSFIALYVLFNLLALQDEMMTNYDTTVEHYGNELDHPSLEAMLTSLLLNEVPDWTLEQQQEIHGEYFQQKNHRRGLRVPATLETGLSLSLAERYRLAGNARQARILVKSAVENHPGHVPLLELEQNFDPAQEINWMNTVRSTRAVEDGEDPVAGADAHDSQIATSEAFGRPSTLADGISS